MQLTILQDSEIPVHIAIDASTCVHHWLIEPPKGASSQALCKKCGQVRSFSNVAVDVEGKPISTPADNTSDFSTLKNGS